MPARTRLAPQTAWPMPSSCFQQVLLRTIFPSLQACLRLDHQAERCYLAFQGTSTGSETAQMVIRATRA